MSELRLVLPSTEYLAEIAAFRKEMLEAGSDFAGCGGLRSADSCQKWLDDLSALASKESCPTGYVPSNTFLAVRKSDGRIVGIIELRQKIDTPILSTWGGHIGFSVRPSERNKGYAKEMLRLLLLICRDRGHDRVLIACNSENVASERTIIANGGVFEGTVLVNKREIKRFWITLLA